MKSLLSHQNWHLNTVNPDLLKEIKSSLGCSTTLARIIARRFDDRYQTLTEEFSSGFHCPEQLPDISPAISRLAQALQNQEKILIHGDFDVDGLSSAAILYRGLIDLAPSLSKSLKVEVGSRELGHGLNRVVTSRLINKDYDLLITTDCGVSNNQEIKTLGEQGIDTIVTDHHHPPDILPPAVAVVDPKREGSTYPNPYLSGSGIAFKIIEALQEEWGAVDNQYLLSQLAALGTIADLSPLIKKGEQENRILIRNGLQRLRESPLTGIAALAERTDTKIGQISSRELSFRIIPKLNAANRVGDPKVGLLLLTTNDPQRADYLAEVLLDYDKDRSSVQSNLISKAKARLRDRDTDPAQEGIIFVVGQEWNPGVIGLTASRLSNQYSLPAVITSVENNTARGSARSIEGFDIVEGLSNCDDLLDQYGGHARAGGFTTHPRYLDRIYERLSEWGKSKLNGEAYSEATTQILDAKVELQQLDLNLWEELDKLKPFGIGNPRPKFLLPNTRLSDVRTVGKKNSHLKSTLVSNGDKIDCIGFNMADALEQINENEEHNIVFNLGIDTWGKRSIQLELEDFLL